MDIEPQPSMAHRFKPLKDLPPHQLLIHEMYASIQGESTFAGLPCTFIRTTACPLRCSYCDTAAAFYKGSTYTIEAILQRVDDLGLPCVEITGGEPLMQRQVLSLMHQLCNKSYTVLLETSGALSIADVDPRVHIILDIKTPGSHEVDANDWSNIQHLLPHHQIKLVLTSEEDYQWALQKIAHYQLDTRYHVLFSVAWGRLSLKDLAAWMLRDKVKARLQIQMHKVIWDPQAKGV